MLYITNKGIRGDLVSLLLTDTTPTLACSPFPDNNIHRSTTRQYSHYMNSTEYAAEKFICSGCGRIMILLFLPKEYKFNSKYWNNYA